MRIPSLPQHVNFLATCAKEPGHTPVATTLIAFILTLLLMIPVWANPAPTAGAPPPLIPLIIFLDYAVDLFFIVFALVILRKAVMLPLRSILLVAIAAMVGGLIADGMGGAATEWWMAKCHRCISPMRFQMVSFLSRVLIPVPLIFMVNYVLGRRFLDLSRREATVLGLVVGVFTTPIVYEAFDQFEVRWLGDTLHLYAAHERMPLYDYFSPFAFACAAGAFAFGDVLLLHHLKRHAKQKNRYAVPLAYIGVTTFALLYIVPLLNIRNRSIQIRAYTTNLKMIGMAALVYKQDTGGFPEHIELLVPKYLPDRHLLHCPSDRRSVEVVSYSYQKPPDTLRSPAEFPMVRCGYHPHPTLAFYVYADGSVRGGPR